MKSNITKIEKSWQHWWFCAFWVRHIFTIFCCCWCSIFLAWRREVITSNSSSSLVVVAEAAAVFVVSFLSWKPFVNVSVANYSFDVAEIIVQRIRFLSHIETREQNVAIFFWTKLAIRTVLYVVKREILLLFNVANVRSIKTFSGPAGQIKCRKEIPLEFLCWPFIKNQ